LTLAAPALAGAPRQDRRRRRSWPYCLLRTPRRARPFRKDPGPWRILAAALAVVLVLLAAMYTLDVWALRTAHSWLPHTFWPFQPVTRIGKSDVWLVPSAICIGVASLLATLAATRRRAGMFSLQALRATFIFAAIVVPGLFSSLLKWILGRARPSSIGTEALFDYQPFSLRPEFTSLPSGHAATVFAAAVAITALWPRTAIFMWPLAITVALSRVLVMAHNPSDVIAGAIVGIVGALLVRRWFALRALVFSFDQVGKGLVKPVRGRPRARSAVG